MPLSLTRNQAIAVTWTTDSCHAVRLRAATGNVCRVEACWHGTVGKECASLAELLLHAVKAVGANDDIYIIAGGNDQGWGMADLAMPAALKHEELKNALAFELRKQTPLAADKLRWGYRVLPRRAGAATQTVRLFYVRTEHWNSWIKAADGLPHIDALLPAPVALDPVLAGNPFLAATSYSDECYEYTPTDEGTRAIVPRCADDLPKRLAERFPAELCNSGALGSLEEPQKCNFAQAIVLGLYGMTACVNADQKTLLPIPERFHARRNIAAKVAAACLAIYLLGVLVYALAGNFSGHAAQIRQIDQALKRTRDELTKLRALNDPKDNERVALVRQELLDNTPNRPDLPAALLAVTTVVPTTHWIADAFEWRNGQISFKVQGAAKDLELTSKLEDSRFLGDVTERLSTMNNGSYSQRFEATARYDTPIEADILKTREETVRQKAREKAERERKAAEAAAAAELPEAETELDESEEVQP